MKARIKGESEWKDYKTVFNPDGVFIGLETAGYYEGNNEGGINQVIDSSGATIITSKQRRYVSEILPLECFDLWSEPDWDAYCRDVAKDIFVGLITNRYLSHGEIQADSYTSRWAIRVAKNFVDDLKEQI